MADPKYAHLPGIDWSAPDLYETSDLPEDEQRFSSYSDESEAVEKISVDPSDSYKRFKGKIVDGGAIDFSDQIDRSRKTGYECRTEYEMLEDGSVIKETPLQKYQRLQHEIRELVEDVTKIKSTVKEESGTEKLSPVAIGKQLEYLQHQLTDLHLEKLLGPQASVDLSDLQGELRKRLLTELDSYKISTPGQEKQQPLKPSSSSEDHVTYELYYRPEQAHFSKNAKLANLEERLERLETVIGQPQEKMGLLTADIANKDLLSSVSVLNSKLNVLEPTNIEQVEARLHNVLQKLSQVAEKKSNSEEVDDEQKGKIEELYNTVKKWEQVADSLPHVVDRLTGLRELHEQAMQFSQALTYLDTTQQELNSTLKSQGDSLKQLQENFNSNNKSIIDNCANIDERIKVLSK